MAKTLTTIAIVALTAGLLTSESCQRSRPASVTSAVDALRKLKTAVEIGVSYEQYSTLLIDAKTKVDGANTSLEDGPFRVHLNSALDNYLDAATVWKMAIRNEPISLRSYPGQIILPKYSIQVDSEGVTTDYKTALDAIWQAADFRMTEMAKGEIEGGQGIF